MLRRGRRPARTDARPSRPRRPPAVHRLSTACPAAVVRAVRRSGGTPRLGTAQSLDRRRNRVPRHPTAPPGRVTQPCRLEGDGQDRRPDVARDGGRRRAATSRCCSTETATRGVVRARLQTTNFELAVQTAGSVADFALRGTDAVSRAAAGQCLAATASAADTAGRQQPAREPRRRHAAGGLAAGAVAGRPDRPGLAARADPDTDRRGRPLDRELARSLIALREEGLRISVIHVDSSPARERRREPRGLLLSLASAGVPCLTLNRGDDLRTALSLWRADESAAGPDERRRASSSTSAASSASPSRGRSRSSASADPPSAPLLVWAVIVAALAGAPGSDPPARVARRSWSCCPSEPTWSLRTQMPVPPTVKGLGGAARLLPGAGCTGADAYATRFPLRLRRRGRAQAAPVADRLRGHRARRVPGAQPAQGASGDRRRPRAPRVRPHDRQDGPGRMAAARLPVPGRLPARRSRARSQRQAVDAAATRLPAPSTAIARLAARPVRCWERRLWRRASRGRTGDLGIAIGAQRTAKLVFQLDGGTTPACSIQPRTRRSWASPRPSLRTGEPTLSTTSTGRPGSVATLYDHALQGVSSSGSYSYAVPADGPAPGRAGHRDLRHHGTLHGLPLHGRDTARAGPRRNRPGPH